MSSKSDLIAVVFLGVLCIIQVIACYASYLYPALQAMPWYMFWSPTLIVGAILVFIMLCLLCAVYVVYRNTKFENFKKLHDA